MGSSSDACFRLPCFAFAVPQWTIAVWEGSVRMLVFGITGFREGMGLYSGCMLEIWNCLSVF